MVTLYVEGGGDSDQTRSAYREGLRTFLENAGLSGKMPRIKAKGGRNEAYAGYCDTHKRKGGNASMLLVDSEDPVSAARQSGKPAKWQPWQHLNQRDGWNKPSGASDMDCHLMVQCMENWFLADPQSLAKYYGQGFQAPQLPSVGQSIEGIPKETAQSGLSKATTSTTKGKYSKGKHAFDLLHKVDPKKVIAKSPWAKRFINEVSTR